MGKSFLIAMGIGVAAVAAVITSVVVLQWNTHMELNGRIVKVRTAAIDEHSSAVVVDFRFTNPARYAFVVRSVTVVLEDPAGKQYDGVTIAGTDTQRIFEGIPLLGRKYNEPLIGGDRLASHASEDRMVVARFELPNDKLESRKRLLLEIREVDGAESQLTEK